jgi:hypothetical protein
MYGSIPYRSPSNKYLTISSYRKDVTDKFDYTSSTVEHFNSAILGNIMD